MSYEKAYFHEKVGEFFTPRVVLAWPNVITARRVKGDESSAARFTVIGLVLKAYDISALLEEWNRVGKDEHGSAWPKKKLNYPAIYATAEDPALEEYAEAFPWAIKASTKEEYKPKLYGPPVGGGKPPPKWEGEADEIYSGRRAIIGGKFFGFKKGKGGVSFGLNRIILLEHGEPLSLSGGGAREFTDDGGFEPVDIGDGQSASEMFS